MSADLKQLNIESGVITMANIEPETYKSNMAIAFRTAIDPDGRVFVQGAYECSKGFKSWLEWEELKPVPVDHNGKEIE
jgi:hypothetical protein